MTPLREQQRRASAPYLKGRVRVGVGFVPTMDAGKDRLALTALCIDDTAGRTGLRGERGGDVDQPAPCGFKLVFEQFGKPGPTLRKDGAVEPGLLPNALTGRPGGHAGDIQRLQRDDPKPTGNGGAGDVEGVSANPGHFLVETRNARSLLRIPARALLATRQNPLGLTAAVLQTSHVSETDDLAGGKRQCVGHPPVNADSGQRAQGCGSRAYVAGEGDAPFSARPADGGVHHLADEITASAVADPADMGEADFRPTGVDVPPTDTHALKANAVVLSANPPRRIAGTTGEEALKGAVEVTKRLLQHAARKGRDEIVFAAQLGHLKGLLRPRQVLAGRRPILPPKVPALLERQVVDKAGDASPLAEGFRLIWRGFEPEFEAAMHGGTVAQSIPPQHQTGVSL